MNWLGKLLPGTQKPRRLADQVQEAAWILIVGGYRRLAASQGCAPTSKTSDQKIIEIYRKVATAFRQDADKRGERIPAEVMNHIVWYFLQAYEDLGDAMVDSHLAYEVQKYAKEGLRPDYNRNLDLVGTEDSQIEEQSKQAKQAISPAEVAEALVQGIRSWPAKYGESLRRDFGDVFKQPVDAVFDEVKYFLSFGADFALHSMLKDKSGIQTAVRDAFAKELRDFAVQNHCKPVPSGEWLGDQRIWLTTGDIPNESGDPVVNLNDRFDLYIEVLKRGKDKPVGESLGFLLAGLCGTMDIVFITYAAEIFLGQISAIRNFLDSFEIVVKDDRPPAQSARAQSPRVTAALSNSETAKEPQIVTSPEPTVQVWTTMTADGKETHELTWTAETTRGELLDYSENTIDKLNIPQADKDRMKQEIARALWPNEQPKEAVSSTSVPQPRAEARPGHPMTCPNCDLVNPPGAIWCDCGYDFTTRQLRP